MTVKLLDAFANLEAYESPDNLETVYLVANYVPKDLYHLLKEKTKMRETEVKKVAHDLLKALKLLHSAGFIHRDLTPRNILVGPNFETQLCDFGWSRSIVNHRANKPGS